MFPERKTMKPGSLTPARFHSRVLAALRTLAVAALVVPAVALAQAPDAAAGYPPQQIRFVVPFTAGGGTDVIMRIVAKHLSENWKITALVDNRVGAGGVVGSQYVTTQKPDGRTFLAVASAFAVRAAIDRSLPYDATRDFSGVGQMARSPSFMVVATSHGFGSLKELIAYAKSRPGELNYSSSGNGSATHLAGVLFGNMAGINIVHVPYKGLTPAFNDVLAGEVPMIIPGLVTVLPYHTTGRLRIIATTGATRTGVTPEIPTIAQAGVPGYEFDSWTGFLAPVGTPAAVVSQIHAELARISKLPDVRDRLTALGFDVIGGTPEAFSAVIRDNNARLGKVIRDAGIKAE